MRILKDHDQAVKEVSEYNKTHAVMFHRAIVKSSDNFVIMPVVDAIICQVQYEEV